MEEGRGREFFLVEGDGVSFFELDDDVFRGIGGIFWVICSAIDDGWGGYAWVFEYFSFCGNVQEVAIDGEGSVAVFVFGYDDLILFCELDHVVSPFEVPLAPRGDNLDIGVEGVVSEFETDLVIAFSSGPVADGVGICVFSDFDLSFCDERSCDGGSEEVDSFVEGIGAEHGEDVFSDEFFT